MVDVDEIDDVLDSVGLEDVDPPAIAGAITTLGALVGAVFARKAIARSWASLTGREPPENPAADQTTWGEALAFAALGGLVAGVARMAGRRVATRAAARLTGEDERRLA